MAKKKEVVNTVSYQNRRLQARRLSDMKMPMPVFTIKGKDQFAVPTIRFWLSLAARRVNVQKLKRTINDLEIIENYQEERYKLPD